MTAYVLTAIQYGVFLIFVVLAMMQTYAALYSKEERRFMRNRVKRNLRKQNEVTKKRAAESEVTLMFGEAHLPWMNTLRFALLRVIGLMGGLMYLSFTTSWTNTVLFMVFWLVLTEPLFKFSLIRLYLARRIKKITEKKEGELFSLFAMLKTDLIGNTRDEINVYHLLKDTLPYVYYIKPMVNQFLRQWKESPQTAGQNFESALGGETAQFLGDFLGGLHRMDRDNALQVLEEQNEVFGHRRSEMLLQKAEVQRNSFYTFFFLSAFAVIGWFMWFMFQMTSQSMNF
ncbi:hypothetical protein [Planomicrobium okeanokoites]|uniref:hypothetical protein n=1 Tax=Planomicrobium okeanokoites TaxID=244 RepID=UPI002492D616|nr:hypothetical protein [Planomicrobium okeanokoites]